METHIGEVLTGADLESWLFLVKVRNTAGVPIESDDVRPELNVAVKTNRLTTQR